MADGTVACGQPLCLLAHGFSLLAATVSCPGVSGRTWGGCAARAEVRGSGGQDKIRRDRWSRSRPFHHCIFGVPIRTFAKPQVRLGGGFCRHTSVPSVLQMFHILKSFRILSCPSALGPCGAAALCPLWFESVFAFIRLHRDGMAGVRDQWSRLYMLRARGRPGQAVGGPVRARLRTRVRVIRTLSCFTRDHHTIDVCRTSKGESRGASPGHRGSRRGGSVFLLQRDRVSESRAPQT